MIRAFATHEPNGALQPFEYDPGPLAANQVEIDVVTCGICHSDLSVANNDWGYSKYPIVPGHEVIGTVGAIGDGVTSLQQGDTVGLGWLSGSCMSCDQCIDGDQNLCASAEATIVGRFGGFAEKVRCNEEWAIRLPDGVDASKAGPLFCGGVTVFTPIVEFGVKPTDRVGVVGIGGLGHLALQFLNKWGCEVTAFTSSASKHEEALRMGAHHAVDSRDPDALEKVRGSFDFILSTVNVELDWVSYWKALGPKGRLHAVGAVPKPIPAPTALMMGGQKSVSASPVGSIGTTRRMLEFCARHDIEAVTEHYPMSKVNDAFEHLKSGKARYRLVLENDFA